MRRAIRRCGVAGAMAAALTAPLEAQQAREGPALLVLDEATLAPLPGAVVFVGGVGPLYTDGDGRARLPPIAARRITLTVSALGYRTREVAAGPADASLTVRLRPDPPVLEGLRVVVDRLDYLRARTFGPIRVMDGRELAGRARGGLAAHARLMVGGIGPCAQVAGGCDGEPAVLLVDDWTFPFRLDELDEFDPASLYALEAYPRQSIVRVYTREFMARAAANPRLVRIHSVRGAPAIVTASRAPIFPGVIRP